MLLNTLAMLLQQSINGGYTVLAQSALSSDDSITAEMFALLRDSGASAVLLLTTYVLHRRSLVADPSSGPVHPRTYWETLPAKEHLGLLGLCGLCGVWGGQLLGAIAIKELGAVIFSVMQPAQPVLTLIISAAIGMEPLALVSGGPRERAIGWAKVIGMVITVLGAVLIVLLSHHKSSTTGSSPGFGYCVLFVEVFLGACYGIFQKKLLPHYSALSVCAWGYALGTAEIVITLVFFWPLCSAAPSLESTIPQPAHRSFWHVPLNSVGPIVYAILLNSALGYFIMSWVNARTSPFFYTLFFPVQFFVASLLAFLFLSAHQISYIVFVGGGCITLGLYIVLFAQSREAKLLAHSNHESFDNCNKSLVEDVEEASASEEQLVTH